MARHRGVVKVGGPRVSLSESEMRTRGNGVAHKEGQLARSDISINSPHTLCLSSRPPPFISPHVCVSFTRLKTQITPSFLSFLLLLLILFSPISILFLLSFFLLKRDRAFLLPSSNHVWHTCSVRLLR